MSADWFAVRFIWFGPSWWPLSNPQVSSSELQELYICCCWNWLLEC